MVNFNPKGHIFISRIGPVGSTTTMSILSTGLSQIQRIDLPPLLGEGERGALVMPAIETEGQAFKPIGFDTEYTRFAILLFDKIVYPANSAISIGKLRDITGDISCAIDSRVEIGACHAREAFSIALGAMFQALEEREPGLWSLARGIGGVQLPDDFFGEMTAFKLKLENALPMPDREVPFEEVANYRDRRRSELMALRHYIEGLVLEVQRDGFHDLAKRRAFEAFQSALSDHTKAINETNWLKRAVSLDLTFNWTDAAKTVIPAALIGNFDVALGLEILAASLSIESASSLLKRRKNSGPFDYVFRATSEI